MKEQHEVWFFRIIFCLVLGALAVAVYVDPLKEDRPVMIVRR